MFYTGCSYRGETTPDGKRFNEQGVYTFANGDTYVGAFKDGRMHGHGTLFFTAERGGGQYRGVWEDGRNVSGAFVFADGLVYGSGEDTATAHTTAVNNSASATGSRKPEVKRGVDGGAPPGNEPGTARNARENVAEEWLYCREGDRRLWAEHLREVMPVLPMQSVLGGVRVPQSSRWAVEPVVAPSVAAEAKIPATFVLGQPRSLAEVPADYWEEPQQREGVIASMELPTPPFRGAQAGAGREETMVDSGDKPAVNLSLRIIAPLESEAMRRAIAAAVSASASAAKASQEGAPPPQRPPPSSDTTGHSGVGRLLASSEADAVENKTATADDDSVEAQHRTSGNLSSHDATVAPCPSNRPSSASLTSRGPSAFEPKDAVCEALEGGACKLVSEATQEVAAPSANIETVMAASLVQEQSETDVKRQDDLKENEHQQQEGAYAEEQYDAQAEEQHDAQAEEQHDVHEQDGQLEERSV
ncbi:uncharacterized protein Tco025E_02062 [Trypanosoma conorhini]|uniref:MORN repeat-containing protein 5 n=1 Tax=Trypanosoma conorhini TaxID=83891 RepID=A0A3R7M3C4_9TRYP|nr:uncharacterized protein Tco025E_02062 [Trypanosoma conorhini]RNF25807.1 hypothetical protein Tco025E_02062 [Trypanosoma conorhini]